MCYVLRFIKENKFQGESAPIYKRRYLLVLTHWAKIMPKPHFLDYFNSVLESLSEIGGQQAMRPLD